jgi:hypothetical protein
MSLRQTCNVFPEPHSIVATPCYPPDQVSLIGSPLPEYGKRHFLLIKHSPQARDSWTVHGIAISLFVNPIDQEKLVLVSIG